MIQTGTLDNIEKQTVCSTLKSRKKRNTISYLNLELIEPRVQRAKTTTI